MCGSKIRTLIHSYVTHVKSPFITPCHSRANNCRTAGVARRRRRCGRAFAEAVFRVSTRNRESRRKGGSSLIRGQNKAGTRTRVAAVRGSRLLHTMQSRQSLNLSLTHPQPSPHPPPTPNPSSRGSPLASCTLRTGSSVRQQLSGSRFRSFLHSTTRRLFRPERVSPCRGVPLSASLQFALSLSLPRLNNPFNTGGTTNPFIRGAISRETRDGEEKNGREREKVKSTTIRPRESSSSISIVREEARAEWLLSVGRSLNRLRERIKASWT